MPPLNLGGKNGAGRCFAKIYYTYKKLFLVKNREKVKPLCKSRRECCRICVMPLRRLPAQQDGLHILSEPPDPVCRIVAASEQNSAKLCLYVQKSRTRRGKTGRKTLSVLAICAALAANKTTGSTSGSCRPAHCAPVQSKLFAFFAVAADPQVECNARAQCLAAFAARPVSKQHKTRRSCGRARVNLRSVSLAEEPEEILLKSVPQTA